MYENWETSKKLNKKSFSKKKSVMVYVYKKPDLSSRKTLVQSQEHWMIIKKKYKSTNSFSKNMLFISIQCSS